MTFALLVLIAITSTGVLAGKDMQCFTCNSADNPDCPLFDFDESKYTKSNMTCASSSTETMNSVQRLLYPNELVETINTLSNSKLSEDRCVKFTASHQDVDESITFRGCFLNGHYACRHIEEVLKSAGAQLEQCHQCKHKIYCNSGYQIQISVFCLLTVFASLFYAF